MAFEYKRTQLDKAKGHLFRAAFDSFDGIAISCQSWIKEAFRGVSPDGIMAAFPDYYERIATLIEFSEKISKHRGEKDIGDASFDTLERYRADVEKVVDLTKEALRRARAAREFDSRRFWQKYKDIGLYGVPTAIIAALIGALVAYVFGK